MEKINYDSKHYFSVLDRYLRAANYLTSAQLYLKANPLLKTPLEKGEIKKKIVGHWGTCPGQSFIYTGLTRAISKYSQNMIYISGPGHGGNFFISHSYIEGVYTDVYPEVTKDLAGLTKLFKQFSTPMGVGSHCDPEVPGSLHEGGELGYSLSHAFGTVLDNKDLICACVVGDGEAETGPLSGGWWGIKFLNPKTDGAVLPILHMNGYKIANPSILSRISNSDRKKYFEGFGYEVFEVECGFDEKNELDKHKKFAKVIDCAVEKIHKFWNKARNGENVGTFRYPLIILKTPKGWTGVANADGKQIEDSFRAHQVPVDMSKEQHVAIVEKWLRSYKPEELFNDDGTIMEDILTINPSKEMSLSGNRLTYGGVTDLKLPNIDVVGIDVTSKNRGEMLASDMVELSKYVAQIINVNSNFRFFTPDEAKSNRLYEPFNVTKRMFAAQIKDTDEDLSSEGRIIDSLLSEHMCEGLLEGYVLTGRHGFFASYEAFARVVDSMLSQHAKWLNISSKIPFREKIPSLNIICTSHTFQQDHNGFSHQDTGIVSHMLDKKLDTVRAYYPIDANTLIATMDKCFKDNHKINIVTASKHPSRQFFSKKEAQEIVENGIGVIEFLNSEIAGQEPDVVIASVGDTPNFEVMHAVRILKEKLPKLSVRYINVQNILTLDKDYVENVSNFKAADVEKMFTKNKPIIFASHCYPNLIKALTSNWSNRNITTLGYSEEGRITTGFDMRVLNKVDRFNIVKTALSNLPKKPEYKEIDKQMDKALVDHRQYIIDEGIDPEFVMKNPVK